MADNFTPEEQYRFIVITKVIDKEMKPGQAAKLLGISTRQIRRLKLAVQDDGLTVVVHGLKGKQGNHILIFPLRKMLFLLFMKTILILNLHLLLKNWKKTMLFTLVMEQHGYG